MNGCSSCSSQSRHMFRSTPALHEKNGQKLESHYEHKRHTLFTPHPRHKPIFRLPPLKAKPKGVGYDVTQGSRQGNDSFTHGSLALAPAGFCNLRDRAKTNSQFRRADLGWICSIQECKTAAIASCFEAIAKIRRSRRSNKDDLKQ